MRKEIGLEQSYYKITLKKVYFLTMLFSILGTYLYFANDIVIYLTKQKNEVILRVTAPYESSNNIFYAIDKSEINTTDKNMIQIAGWAFVSALNSNEKRKIKLVLSGTRNTYECNTLLSFRKDVTSGMDDQINEVNKENDNLGMMAYFSALNMKDDIYQLGIYVQENEKESGFTNTNIYFIKNRGQLQRYYGQVVENMKLDTGKDIVYTLDKFTRDENNNEFSILRGAIIKKGFDTTKQKVYIQLQNEQGDLFTYSTVPYENSTFESFYNNKKYANAGFMCAIPNEALKEGAYVVSVALKTDELKFAPYTVNRIYSKDKVGNGTIKRKINEDIKVEITDKITSAIDSIQLQEDKLYISGWIIEENQSSFAGEVLVQLINEKDKDIQFFTADSIFRPDISQAYNMDIDYLNSGFECKVPLDYIKEGKYSVNVILYSGDYKKSQLQTAISYKENEISIERNIE